MDIVEKLRDQFDGYDETKLKAANEIERLRDALYDIQDMPEDWESDEEMNLLFVIDTHIRIAKEALGEKAADKIERLRQQNAELLEVLKLALASHGVVLTSDPPQDAWKANGVAEKARAAIAKATGGE